KLEALTVIEGLKNKDRRALARAITIIESTAEIDKKTASAILQTLKKPEVQSLRLAISGPPGVGKSTFINALGRKLLSHSLKIAILPIDPASPKTSGSILADKTRMHGLLSLPNIFIRPSSSRGILGGVTLAMRDVIALVESFGFDMVIIETVGVGQSETSAYSLADYFLMLMQPGSGDALSAIKKGIMEHADYLVVNKADGELKDLALQTFNMLKSTFKQRDPELFLVSSLSGMGIDELVLKLFSSFEQRKEAGTLEKERIKRFQGFFDLAFAEVMRAKISNVGWIKSECERIIKEIGNDEGSLLAKLDHLGEEISLRLF
ncbi:MAG TPA: GTP-binding protein, partial [Myxococcota bacterium]|nr:GTP-binding protein [Myxococcota bacterium]